MPVKALSALDFLFETTIPEAFVWVIFGDDDYLRSLCLQKLRDHWLAGPEDRLNLCEFDGDEISWPDVYRELVTVSMFSQSPRIVIVDAADAFVSRNRAELETWVTANSGPNRLVLILEQWAGNTRLAKLASEHGVVIECAFSKKRRPELVTWLKNWARERYGLSVETAAAELILDSVGTSCGLIDQELRKLQGLGQKTIKPQTVQQLTGTWRTKTIWDIINAALEGKAAVALQELKRLLEAGESPVGILAMASATLRRYTLATHRYLHPAPGQPRVSLQAALEEAGVPSFALRGDEERLRRLGRHRAAALVHWLCLADAAMKGASAADPRLILEQLIILLARPDVAGSIETSR